MEMAVPARSPLLPHLAPVLAISAFGLTIALGGGAFALADNTYAGVFLPFAVIGLILTWRRPDSPIGWMLSGFGALGVRHGPARGSRERLGLDGGGAAGRLRAGMDLRAARRTTWRRACGGVRRSGCVRSRW